MYISGAMGAAIAIHGDLKLLALLFPIAIILAVIITAEAYFRRPAGSLSPAVASK
jgi:hypothetical protein